MNHSKTMIKQRTLRRLSRFYIHVVLQTLRASVPEPGRVLRQPHQRCQWEEYMTGLIKAEQTDAGHRLVCEGHRNPPLTTTLHPLNLYLCPFFSSAASHGIQNGPDPPERQINAVPLTRREWENL